MQAHTLFELSAYSSDSAQPNPQSPIDLLSPSHLIVDATIRIESGVQPCEGYPSWVAFTGQITQNVAQETHVLCFLLRLYSFPLQVFSLKFAINESQRNFAKLIPYLKADKLISASFAYCFPYEVTQNGADGNPVTQTAAGMVSRRPLSFTSFSMWHHQSFGVPRIPGALDSTAHPCLASTSHCSQPSFPCESTHTGANILGHNNSDSIFFCSASI